MGFVIGIISATLILSAIYFKIDGDKKTLAKALFIAGLIGMMVFASIMMLVIYD